VFRVGAKGKAKQGSDKEAMPNECNSKQQMQAEHLRHQEKLLSQLFPSHGMATAASELRMVQRAAQLAQEVKVEADAW
jgi:hypothetical protein